MQHAHQTSPLSSVSTSAPLIFNGEDLWPRGCYTEGRSQWLLPGGSFPFLTTTVHLASAPLITGSLQTFRGEMNMREMTKSFRSQGTKAVLVDSLLYSITVCN